jgi:hypothetical protein
MVKCAGTESSSINRLGDCAGRRMDKDKSYFFRRAGEEREAARKSTNRLVQQRHLEFADAYDYRGRAIEALERELIVQIVPAS